MPTSTARSEQVIKRQVSEMVDGPWSLHPALIVLGCVALFVLAILFPRKR